MKEGIEKTMKYNFIFIQLGFTSQLPYYLMLISITFLETTIAPDWKLQQIFSISTFSIQIIISGIVVYLEKANQLENMSYGQIITIICNISLPIVQLFNIAAWIKIPIIFVIFGINSIGIAYQVCWLQALATYLNKQFTLDVVLGNVQGGLLIAVLNLMSNMIFTGPDEFIQTIDNNHISNFLSFQFGAIVCSGSFQLSYFYLPNDNFMEESRENADSIEVEVQHIEAEEEEEMLKSVGYFQKKLNKKSTLNSTALENKKAGQEEQENQQWYLQNYMMLANKALTQFLQPSIYLNYQFKLHDDDLNGMSFKDQSHQVLLVFLITDVLSRKACQLYQLTLYPIVIVTALRTIGIVIFLILVQQKELNLVYVLLTVAINGIFEGITVASIYVQGGKQQSLGQGGAILTFSNQAGIVAGSIASIITASFFNLRAL